MRLPPPPASCSFLRNGGEKEQPRGDGCAGTAPLIKKITGHHNGKHPFGVPPDSGFEPGLESLLDGIEGTVGPAIEGIQIEPPTGHDELERRLARDRAEARST